MTRAISQYLRINDSAGVTLHRWQNYYGNTTVSWQNEQWLYIPFVAEGITAGISGDESQMTVQAPATALVIDAFQKAIYEGLFAELSIYQFQTQSGNDQPQSGQQLISQFTGQVVGGRATMTNLVMQLGSALSPIGAQVPPRKFTVAIMGQGVRQ